MKTTEVPSGAATATINAQLRSLEARIDELSNEIKALEAKIEAQEKSQAKEAEKNAAKLKDLETQIENPKNEEDNTDTKFTRWNDPLLEGLRTFDEYREGGEIDKRLNGPDFLETLPPCGNLLKDLLGLP
ncbi:uncharacterized protein FIESC28_09764 [Fusarium coffeatum]|uniref:Uncharacterized protein n=1 Tax=Fusarium coffeatum TaxID=231269 RepID=A0A366QY36_9HYPO|nr:uncharacterized protein FIESC28_09764 [Fusarium coffeatum]RBR09652.1 hypothetical protein FIESC28_09764 [Fusarium coffeatum]